MKEIDLLPEWYKSSKRRQVSYRTQYIGVCILVLIMVMWNFLAVHSISIAEADLSELEVKKISVENVFDKAIQIKHELEKIREKAQVLGEVDSRINMADVMAEISFLLNDNIVLSSFNIEAETFVNDNKEQNRDTTVRIAKSQQTDKKSIHYGDVKFRIILRGMATNAGIVAELICRLEDSPYFFNVIPSFSRNKELRTGKNSAVERQEVSEFEINCYLANYRLDESIVVKKRQFESY
ncbi:MAG: PilN domain-containing protein [Planctomycetota bacterium]|jgi:hypothetical protein